MRLSQSLVIAVLASYAAASPQAPPPPPPPPPKAVSGPGGAPPPPPPPKPVSGPGGPTVSGPGAPVSGPGAPAPPAPPPPPPAPPKPVSGPGGPPVSGPGGPVVGPPAPPPPPPNPPKPVSGPGAPPQIPPAQNTPPAGVPPKPVVPAPQVPPQIPPQIPNPGIIVTLQPTPTGIITVTGLPVGPTVISFTAGQPKNTAFPKGKGPQGSPVQPQPKATASPRAAETECGGGLGPCQAGQYCFDANQDGIISGQEGGRRVGVCFNQPCQSNANCPLEQTCLQGKCLLDYLECTRDDCPDGPGWSCIGGSGWFRTRGSSRCGYTPPLGAGPKYMAM